MISLVNHRDDYGYKPFDLQRRNSTLISSLVKAGSVIYGKPTQ